MLLVGETIHIEGTRRNDSQERYELRYDICTENDAMQSLSHLTGAGHSQDQSSATGHGTRRPCLSTHIFRKARCDGLVRLDVQLLRVCRQIYNESSLLPYAENHFIVSSGFQDRFPEAFIAQFNLEKRSAMHTVAVLQSWKADIELVPTLLPGLKRLWFNIDDATHDPNRSVVANQSRLVEAFSRVKFTSLIGATVRLGWYWSYEEDERMEERLELALLGNHSEVTIDEDLV